MSPSIDSCSIIEIPKISNRAGNISPVQNETILPFDIKRVFYIYDIPGGKKRGGHAHKESHQFLIAASGSYDVIIKDGTNQKRISLNKVYIGLYIPPGIWASEVNFSSGSICLVYTSHLFDEKDYIRNFEKIFGIY